MRRGRWTDFQHETVDIVTTTRENILYWEIDASLSGLGDRLEGRSNYNIVIIFLCFFIWPGPLTLASFSFYILQALL